MLAGSSKFFQADLSLFFENLDFKQQTNLLHSIQHLLENVTCIFRGTIYGIVIIFNNYHFYNRGDVFTITGIISNNKLVIIIIIYFTF